MNRLAPLLETTIILVAHSDDETIAFGALMQRIRRPVVVFATDGAPRGEKFWKPHGSRAAYARARRREAGDALAMAGAEVVFLPDLVEGGIADQELFRCLPVAISVCRQLIHQLRPDALLTLAYEGGHPDHDSVCFISSILAHEADLPVWEAPLYHRDRNAEIVFQSFYQPKGNEVRLQVEGAQLEKKVAMFRGYASQQTVLKDFRPEIEILRPLADYDFGQPPMSWKLNYECWGWRMTAREVAEEFVQCLASENAATPIG